MNRSTSETQQQMPNEEGLPPILAWIKRLCDHIVHNLLGADTIEFTWRADEVIEIPPYSGKTSPPSSAPA